MASKFVKMFFFFIVNCLFLNAAQTAMYIAGEHNEFLEGVKSRKIVIYNNKSKPDISFGINAYGTRLAAILAICSFDGQRRKDGERQSIGIWGDKYQTVDEAVDAIFPKKLVMIAAVENNGYESCFFGIDLYRKRVSEDFSQVIMWSEQIDLNEYIREAIRSNELDVFLMNEEARRRENSSLLASIQKKPKKLNLLHWRWMLF